MVVSKDYLGKVIIIFAVICSIHAYGLYYPVFSGGSDLFDALFYGVIFLTFILALNFYSFNYDENKRYKTIFYATSFLFFALILSSLSGWYFHDQNPLTGLFAARYFAFYLLFFLLCLFAPSKEFVLKLIFIFALGYILVFSIQLVIYPYQIVPFGSIENFDRGLLRIRVEGVGFLTLGGLLALNHYLRYNKPIFLVFFIIAVVYIFLLGFRTLTLAYLLSALFLIFLLYKSDMKKMLMSVVSLSLLIFAFYFSGVLDAYYEVVSERTIEQIEMGDDYIRFQTFDFLFNYVTPGWEALVFGNGVANEHSSYGQILIELGANRLGFIVADLGLIGYVFYFGIFGVVAFLTVYLRVIFSSGGEHTMAIRAFFAYLLISSFTTAEIFRAGMFGVSMIALYLYVLEGWESEKIR
jgi:hypothetical protein